MTRAGYRPLTSPVVTAVCLALLILGPALLPGVVIAYDMVWAPSPRWTPFVLGAGTPAPRAVPSDAVAVLAGTVLTAAVAQKAVLVAVLVLAGTGTASLLRHLRPESSGLAQHAAVIAAMWNPFVAERLGVGQWTVLLGYAVLPWLIRSALRLRALTGSVWATSCWVVLAALGGANSLLVALLGLVVLAFPPVRWRALGAVLLVWLGGAAVWAVPALAGDAPRVTEGATEFLPRADTPFGLIVSLMSGGGFWNPATHPPSRGNWLIALVASILAAAVAAVAVRDLWRRGGRSVLAIALLGFGVCVGSALLSVPWSAVVTALPGGGLVRDSQKLLAPWVMLLALGVALAVDVVRSRIDLRQWTTAAALVIALAPMALLPTLGWGVGGRLHAVEVPDGYRRVADAASTLPAGVVGLLPWNQYRRYQWNGSRVSLTLAPRVIDQALLFDDSLPLANGRVAGEDPRSARVTQQVEQGVDPVMALVEEGVRYLAIELGAGESAEVPEGVGRVVARSPELVIIEVTGSRRAPTESSRWLVLGWAISLLTWGFVMAGATTERLLRSYRLV